MVPDLISHDILDPLLTLMIVVGVVVLVVGIYNFIDSLKRLRGVAEGMDSRTKRIAYGILRAGLGQVTISLAGLWFTCLARWGDFELTEDWGGVSFLVAMYTPLLVVLAWSVFGLIDRYKLDRMDT